jgi:hypothetical protein
MSHIDTFDPKDGASKGPKGAIATKAGYEISEYLPKTATVADKLCVIRSMTAKVGVHAAAQYFMRTGMKSAGPSNIRRSERGHSIISGRATRRSPHPSASIAVLHMAMVSSAPPLARCHPRSRRRPAKRRDPRRTVAIERRLSLADQLDRGFRERYPDENVRAYDEFYDATLQLLKSSDLKAFQLTTEAPAMRDAYGRSKFGQGCLLARRLVESGVRFVEVASNGWDMHTGLEERMEKLGTEV